MKLENGVKPLKIVASLLHDNPYFLRLISYDWVTPFPAAKGI